MKNILAVLALTVSTSVFTMNAFSVPKETVNDEDQPTNIPFYDLDTRKVYIPVIKIRGKPVFSGIELYYRDDGLFELDAIRAYDEATDYIESEVVYVEKIVEVPVEKIVYQYEEVEKIVYVDKIVEVEVPAECSHSPSSSDGKTFPYTEENFTFNSQSPDGMFILADGSIWVITGVTSSGLPSSHSTHTLTIYKGTSALSDPQYGIKSDYFMLIDGAGQTIFVKPI